MLSSFYTRTHTHKQTHAVVPSRSHILVKLAKPQKINLTVYAQNEKNTLFRWLHLPFTVSLHFGYGFSLVLSQKKTTTPKNELALVFVVVVGFSISSRLRFGFDFGLEYFGLASEGHCQRLRGERGSGLHLCRMIVIVACCGCRCCCCCTFVVGLSYLCLSKIQVDIQKRYPPLQSQYFYQFIC